MIYDVFFSSLQSKEESEIVFIRLGSSLRGLVRRVSLKFHGKSLETKNSTQPSLVSNFVVSTPTGEGTKPLNKSNMASLAEQLRSLTNPEPSRFDLDEDEFDLTKAQVINKGSDLGDIKNQIESNASNLRKKTVPLLQDEDKKYAGRKISRADLAASRGYIDGSYSEAESDIASDSEGMGALLLK